MKTNLGRISRIGMLALLLVLAFGAHAQAAMLMTPYLQAVTETSVCVMVECDTKDPVTVQYGPKVEYGKTATTEITLPTDTKAAETYVHRIKLIGLKANSLYHYRATQDKTTYTTDYTFNTAVTPGKPFRFAALGDFRSGTAIHEAIVAKIKTANPRFSIYGGDLCNDNSYKMFKKEFFQPNELALSASAPFFNTPGNHEGWSQNTKAFTQSPLAPADAQGYYSFDYGDAHFVSINNQTNYGENSAQWKFVKKDLENSKKLWKIVFFHEPAYCAGGHNENKNMVAMTTKLFEPNRVNIVIAGHTHLYQHNLVNGIHHFVLGAAGAPLYEPGAAPYVLKSAKVQHYAIIDVTKDKLVVNVYKEDGSQLDKLELANPAKK
ncbi:MAG: metallophosphoesterase family protein [Armatimonadetes bacterium]|nr:metallophosphoesterase family protein [Armatimonadota bacterium]